MGKRRRERGISGAAPMTPLPPPPHGRQGLGSDTSKRLGSMFKLGPDSGEGDPRPESPWGWGSFLSRGSTAPITRGAPQAKPLDQRLCKTRVALSG